MRAGQPPEQSCRKLGGAIAGKKSAQTLTGGSRKPGVCEFLTDIRAVATVLSEAEPQSLVEFFSERSPIAA